MESGGSGFDIAYVEPLCITWHDIVQVLEFLLDGEVVITSYL